MKIFWDNLADESVLTPSSTRTGYDIANITNYHLSKVFDFGAASGEVVINLGSSTNIKDVILAGTNLTSSATVSLQGNTSDSWTSPIYNESMTRYTNGYWGIKLDDTYRYWRVVVSDATITSAAIGYLFIGDSLQLPPINPAVELEYANTSAVSFSVSGQTYGDTGYEYFKSSFDFPIITDYVRQVDGVDIATREDVLVFWGLNQGAKPVIISIFDNSRDKIPPFMGLITQNSLKFKFSKDMGYYSTNMSITETK
jgi:hypothetical protein